MAKASKLLFKWVSEITAGICKGRSFPSSLLATVSTPFSLSLLIEAYYCISSRSLRLLSLFPIFSGPYFPVGGKKQLSTFVLLSFFPSFLPFNFQFNLFIFDTWSNSRPSSPFPSSLPAHILTSPISPPKNGPTSAQQHDNEDARSAAEHNSRIDCPYYPYSIFLATGLSRRCIIRTLVVVVERVRTCVDKLRCIFLFPQAR